MGIKTDKSETSRVIRKRLEAMAREFMPGRDREGFGKVHIGDVYLLMAEAVDAADEIRQKRGEK